MGSEIEEGKQTQQSSNYIQTAEQVKWKRN